MAQLVVRNLEENVKDRLKIRAVRNHHSLEEEVRSILRDAVADVNEDAPLGTWIASRFAEFGFEEGEIQEMRGEIKPATFEE